MGKLNEGIKTINATVRTVILAAFTLVVGYAGYLVYAEYTKQDRLLKSQEAKLTSLQDELVTKDAEISQLGQEIQSKLKEIAEKNQEIERLETSMILLKTDQRLARLEVLEVERDPEGKAIQSRLRFVELTPNGDAIGESKEVQLPGDIVYVDNWIIKFDDEYIQRGDVSTRHFIVPFPPDF